MTDTTSNTTTAAPAPHKLAAGAPFPTLKWNAVGGGTVDVAETPGWKLVVVYRGRHCPLCKVYLKELNRLLPDFKDAGCAVFAVSADPAEKAEADTSEEGWAFPVGYGLAVDEMRALGLYVSAPRSAQETDRPFAEPGLFAINPKGGTQIIELSNAPYARAELAGILRGVRSIQAKGSPVRGTA